MWGPPATSSLNQAKPRLSPEQGGWGLRTWVPKAQEHPCNPPGSVGAPFNKTSKHPRAVGGRCVQTHEYFTRPPPWAVLSTGTRVSVGAAPRGPAGAPVSSWSLHQPRRALASPTGPAQSLFSISIHSFMAGHQGHCGREHPCYGDRQCVSHECVSMRLAGMEMSLLGIPGCPQSIIV